MLLLLAPDAYLLPAGAGKTVLAYVPLIMLQNIVDA